MAVESNVNTFEFIWRINNYSMSYQKNGEFLRSPEFNAACLGGSRWYLTLYPKGKSKRNEGYISCYLNRCDDCAEENITVCYGLYFLTPNNKIFAQGQSNKNQEFGKSTLLGFNKFIKQEIVFHNLKRWSEDILTIQCIITRDELISRCETETEIGFDQYFFSLDIKFDILNNSKVETFSFTETSSVDAEIINTPNNICIFFKNVQRIKLQFFKCKITVLSNDNNEEISKTAYHLFASTADIVKFPSIPISVGTEDSLEHKIFSFKFEFCIPNGKESYNDIHGIDAITSLRNDMCSMLLEKSHTDVILKVDQHEIPAHKFFLSARSPIFFTMFEQDMTEYNTGIVNITDIDVDTFKAFVHFLYTGKVADMNYSNTSKLLIAGDKYKVKSLVGKCSSFLICIMCMQNVLDTLVLADMISYQPLKVFALNYIKSNAVEFLSTPDWPQFLKNNCELGSEILFKLSLHVTESLKI